MPLLTKMLGRMLGERRKRSLVFVRDIVQEARSAGWMETAITGRPANADGRPIPWISYPAIAFLETRDFSDLRVFEYGSGASTEWWAARAKAVVSVEHDRDWYDAVKPRLPASVDYRFIPLDAGYSATIEQAGSFDIAVIDGRHRNDCAKSCADSGIPAILWDNTDRSEYAPGLQMLAERGYRRIDFRGFGPVNTYQSTTSVLYLPGNRVGL